MRKSITRTLGFTEIEGFKLVLKDGEPTVEKLAPFKVAGKLDTKNALKALKSEFGNDESLTVGRLTYEEGTYEISVSDFIKYAKKVENENGKTTEDAKA